MMTEEIDLSAKRSFWARLRLALSLLPCLVRLPFTYAAAVDEMLDNDLVAVRKRLLRLLPTTPELALDRFPVKMLLARAFLETGDPAAAAALFPQAFRPAHYSRTLNNSERSFLKYVGNDIYERATKQLGRPSSFDVQVEFHDLDLAQVSERLRGAFPHVQRRHRPKNH
jgi:hypothetical protein